MDFNNMGHLSDPGISLVHKCLKYRHLVDSVTNVIFNKNYI